MIQEKNIKRIISLRKVLFALLFGVISGFCLVFGNELDKTDAINLKSPALYGKTLLIALVSAFVCFLTWTLFDLLRERGRKTSKLSFRLPYSALAIGMFLAWVPTWLSIYPGAFSYDAYDEWKMVADSTLNTHHPIVHVLFSGGSVELFHSLTGSYNIGIAVITALQMAIQAGLFAFAIYKTDKMSGSPIVRIIFALYYALHPVIVLFSVATTKDTLFSALEMLFFLYLFDLFRDREKFLKDYKGVIGLGITGLFTMILRNNGLYIALICFIVVFVSLLKSIKKHYLKVAVLLGILIIPYILYVGPLYSALGVSKDGGQEKLSMPLQQMTRVYHYCNESITEEDKLLFYNYVPEDALELYKPTCSDNIKSRFNNEYYVENRAEFYKLWVKWGKENPAIYIVQFLVNTVDAWHPGSLIDGYRMGDGEKSDYFDYRVAPPGDDAHLLGGLNDVWYRVSYDKDSQKGLLYTLLFSPGWYFLCFMAIWLYAAYKKDRGFLLAGILHIVHFLTLLLGPMALVRYELNFFYGLPFFIWAVLFGYREAAEDKN